MGTNRKVLRNANLPYRIVRPLARIALTTFFRKIYFSNAQVLPKDKPVILAANHPSAFLEPCILAVLLPRPLHFLVRGDFFKKPLFNKILRSLHMLPIFRMKDGGYKKLKNNFSTFDQCYATLEQNKVIMILAEGTTIHEKRLRPLRKGTARLAFGTLKKYPDLDVQIIPVGVNYTYAERFRSHAMIQFGQPIAIQDYKETFVKDENNAIRDLMQELRKRLEQNVINIENKADEPLVEKLLVFNRNTIPEAAQPAVSKNNHLLKSELKVVKLVNSLREDEKVKLNQKTDDYYEKIAKHQLDDYAVAVGKVPESKSWAIIILGFIPFLLGYLANYIPLKIADLLTERKIKAIEFKASVKVTMSIVLYLVYFLTILLFLVFTGYFKLILLLMAAPFFGYYALLYQEYYKKWKMLSKLKNIPEVQILLLQKIRNSLVTVLNYPV